MSQQQQQYQAFLTPNKKPAPITKNNPPPNRNCGRPSDRLSRHQLKQAMTIVQFDMMKQGRIFRWTCPRGHSSDYLTYRYQKSDGVHAFCEICGATNHWDEIHFNGQEKTDTQ